MQTTDPGKWWFLSCEAFYFHNFILQEAKYLLEPRAAAAVGQSGLMSLYDAMFAQYGVKIAQVSPKNLILKDKTFRNNASKCFLAGAGNETRFLQRRN